MEEKETIKLKDPNEAKESKETKKKHEKHEKREKHEKQDKQNVEIQELKDRVLRIQAEFENYKKRSKGELEDMAKYGAQELVTPLLGVIDNFERAIATRPEESSLEAFYNGVEMIYKQLMEILSSQGLEKISARGEVFDPSYHQGVMNEPVDDEELVGKVTDEFQTGYTLNKKVIRPTMVKVGIKG